MHIRESKKSIEKYFDSNSERLCDLLIRWSKSNNKLVTWRRSEEILLEIKQYYVELSEYIKNDAGSIEAKGQRYCLKILYDTLTNGKKLVAKTFKKA